MLNACPTCQRTFESTEGSFCPADATKLLPVAQVPVARDAKDPYVGHVIAQRYEVRRVVADGGMGRVYEARQFEPERRIAVKILHPAIAEDEVNIERFKREAETSLSLDHTHIVDVHDFAEERPAPGRPNGAWYLVMEYLDGEELRAVVDRHKILPMARVVRIVSQVAIALDGAHARGAVHRDMKPDNVFLVRKPDGDHVKLLDFGSVKFTKDVDRRVKLTAMGTTIGSPFYMSPEQAEGLPDVDHLTDVWALGAILFEMTVGQVPFNAPNGPQILFKILGTEPPIPSFVNETVPPQLDDVMARALSKKRPHRFQSCGQLADALGHAFGLAGDHRAWAVTPEGELAAKLGNVGATTAPAEQKPKSLRPGAQPAPAARPFPLAGADAQKPAARPFPLASPTAPQGAPPQRPLEHGPPTLPPGDLSVPEDYSPIKKPSMGLYLALGGAALLLVLVAVLALR